MKSLFDIPISRRFSSALPADPIQENFTRQVDGRCFSFASPVKPSKPKLVHTSAVLLKDMDTHILDIGKAANILSGSENWPSFKPYAMCYGGHQFGNWAGQLGDGRAINIAEIEINKVNWKFQLKGAGPTPYSRRADGLAVLRSSIREYLCSEAMHHLGVPTSRALSLAITGDMVTRDVLYDGNPKNEKGAIVCRVAPSFIRFGSFEIFAAKGEIEVLKQLVDYTIKEHYSHLGDPSKATYIAFFNEVANRTREMIIHWQRVGFVHGVMNTDNMSILGLTIDYGPYGWLEDYDPNWTPNTTDVQHKRYQFENQASIALWNLFKLANALYPLVEEAAPFEKILDNFKTQFFQDYHKMMLEKLGLYDITTPRDFVHELTEFLEKGEIDMTLFFRKLSDVNSSIDFNNLILNSSYKDSKELEKLMYMGETWFVKLEVLLKNENIDKQERKQKMNLVNPKYVLRNYMAHLAIEQAEKENYSLIDELYNLLLKPYDEQPEMEKWFAKRPDWAKTKIGCSMLSCSS